MNKQAKNPPFLKTKGYSKQLIVGGKPFVMLAGEVHNSSSSSLSYMEPVWDKIANLNCNTAILPITWELVEPIEGEFDFSLVDGLIEGARKRDLRIVLLWFATWKNGLSTYVPNWVKTDLARFPRMQLRSGQLTRVLSCFSEETWNADARAFAEFMKHIRNVDEEKQTVLMVQIENEIGLLGSTRDFSEEAERRFKQQIPQSLARYLNHHTEELLPELRIPWESAGKKIGAWQESFGEIADEVFMAWHMAQFVDRVAEAGRKEYPLSMFVNAWTVQHEGEEPGSYPSGGPVSRMMDVWRCASPNIDLLAPDIYLMDFIAECASYARSGNPLLIPEARRDKWAVANVFYAIGKHDALCFSPFGIESIGNSKVPEVGNVIQEVALNMKGADIRDMLAKCYRLLGDMMPVITEYAGTGNMTGVLQQQYRDIQAVSLGRYILNVNFGKPIIHREYPGAGIIIATSPTEYIIAGHGFKIDFIPKQGDLPNVDFLSIEEGVYRNGEWIPGRRLNGDEYWASLQEEPSVIKVSMYSF